MLRRCKETGIHDPNLQQRVMDAYLLFDALAHALCSQTLTSSIAISSVKRVRMGSWCVLC